MSDGDLTFIGNATTLVRLGPFTFLTDPNFLHAGEHAPLGYGLRSKRLKDPSHQLPELPSLDLVLLSHHHGDHFDDRAAEQLPKDTLIVTEPGSAQKLARQGFDNTVALKTWDRHSLQKDGHQLTISATPAKHAPTLLQPLLPSVMGSLVDYESSDGAQFRLYITGDTLMHSGVAEIARRYTNIDLCLIHLGGTRIAGIMLTMDAQQGVQALRVVAPKAATPIHHDDYTVFTSPLSDFQELASQELPDVELRYIERGETQALSFS